MKAKFWLLILLFVACTKNFPSNTNTFSSEAYPNKVGDHWVYQFSGGYNIYVDVIGESRLPDGESANVWTYNYTNYVDTAYVVSNASSVKIYYAPCWSCTPQFTFEKQEYIFPFTVNSKWFTNASYGDTTKVLSNLTLNVPAGSFENTFELNRKVGYVTNSWTNDTIFYTPNIGITKLHQSEFSLGPLLGNGIWELASFSLK
jgi:hypothetical protein